MNDVNTVNLLCKWLMLGRPDQTLFVKDRLHCTTCDLHKDIAKGSSIYGPIYGYMALWSYITFS